MSSRCDCHDLLIEDCARLGDIAAKLEAEARAEATRLQDVRGVVSAQHWGVCAACLESFPVGTQIKAFNDPVEGTRWVASCCLADDGRIASG